MITTYILASEEYIRNFLNTRIPNEDLPTPNVPNSIKVAGLMIVADLYENRESQIVSDKTVVSISPNPTVMNLLYPYRKNIGI